MRRLLSIAALLACLISCYAQNGESNYKKMITDYVEIKTVSGLTLMCVFQNSLKKIIQ